MGANINGGALQSAAGNPGVRVSFTQELVSQIHPGDCQHWRMQQEKTMKIGWEGDGAMQATCLAVWLRREIGEDMQSVVADYDAVIMTCVSVRWAHERLAGPSLSL